MLIKPKPLKKQKYTGGIVQAKTREEFERDRQKPFIDAIHRLIVDKR